MNTYRALIIDDERLARVTLSDMLADYPGIQVIGEAESVTESINLITSVNPDLLFLDIQLSDGTGFDLLNKISYPGRIIFITAYDEFAIRAFEVNAIHYLMKPVSHRQLSEAISRLDKKEWVKEPVQPTKYKDSDRLLLSCGNFLNFVKVSTIATITAAGDYTLIRTGNGKEFIDSKTMTEWENRLPENHFLRINRSTIINFDAIEETEQVSVNLVLITVKGISQTFRISRSYFKKIRNKFS
ncbi:MAG: response regulator transcription factor [Bacteroidota bacterium]